MLQIRGHKITWPRLIFPVVVTVWVASQFLRGIPTAGNDTLLKTSLALAGVAFGLLAGRPPPSAAKAPEPSPRPG